MMDVSDATADAVAWRFVSAAQPRGLRGDARRHGGALRGI